MKAWSWLNAESGLNSQGEVKLEISFPKVLSFSTGAMICLVIGLWAIGVPFKDPLLIIFLIVMLPGMACAFAAFYYFTLACKIGADGLRPAVPTFYRKVFPWDEISRVSFTWPFYYVRVAGMRGNILLPAEFLLKRPKSLGEILERYAPEGNVLREKVRGVQKV